MKSKEKVILQHCFYSAPLKFNVMLHHSAFMATSTFLAFLLLHLTGAQYSAAESRYKNRKSLADSPQLVLDSWGPWWHFGRQTYTVVLLHLLEIQLFVVNKYLKFPSRSPALLSCQNLAGASLAQVGYENSLFLVPPKKWSAHHDGHIVSIARGVFCGTLYVCVLNNIGKRTEPCGAPLLSLLILRHCPSLVHTVKRRSESISFNELHQMPVKIVFRRFRRRLQCQLVL